MEDQDNLSGRFLNYINKAIDNKLEDITKIASATVQQVNNNGTVDIVIPPSAVVYHGVQNQSIYQNLKVGDQVKVLKEDNSASNMWVIGGFRLSPSIAVSAPSGNSVFSYAALQSQAYSTYLAKIRQRVSGRKFLFIGDTFSGGYTTEGTITGCVEIVVNMLALEENVTYWKSTQSSGVDRCFYKDTSSSISTFESALNDLVDTLTIAQKNSITDIVFVGGYGDLIHAADVSKIRSGIANICRNVSQSSTLIQAKVWVFPVAMAQSNADSYNLLNIYKMAYTYSTNTCFSYVDTCEPMTNMSNLSSDAIHPNQQGQRDIAMSIVKHLTGVDMGAPVYYTQSDVDNEALQTIITGDGV